MARFGGLGFDIDVVINDAESLFIVFMIGESHRCRTMADEIKLQFSYFSIFGLSFLERRFRELHSVPLPLRLKTEPVPRSNLKAEDVSSQLVGTAFRDYVIALPSNEIELSHRWQEQAWLATGVF